MYRRMASVDKCIATYYFDVVRILASYPKASTVDNNVAARRRTNPAVKAEERAVIMGDRVQKNRKFTGTTG